MSRFMLQSSGQKRWRGFVRRERAGKHLYEEVERIFLHDCSGEKGESGLPEKYVSVTIQKTSDGVFIKREEGIQRLLTVLFEKQTENWYDKKKRAESYIVSNRK